MTRLACNNSVALRWKWNHALRQPMPFLFTSSSLSRGAQAATCQPILLRSTILQRKQCVTYGCRGHGKEWPSHFGHRKTKSAFWKSMHVMNASKRVWRNCRMLATNASLQWSVAGLPRNGAVHRWWLLLNGMMQWNCCLVVKPFLKMVIYIGNKLSLWICFL